VVLLGAGAVGDFEVHKKKQANAKLIKTIKHLLVILDPFEKSLEQFRTFTRILI